MTHPARSRTTDRRFYGVVEGIVVSNNDNKGKQGTSGATDNPSISASTEHDCESQNHNVPEDRNDDCRIENVS